MRLRGLALVVAGSLLFVGCATSAPVSGGLTQAKTQAAPSVTTNEGSTAKPSRAAGTCVYTIGGKPAKPVEPPAATGVAETGTLTVTLNFQQGPVVITMDRAKAPCTVNSFESLAQQGFFDGVKCHRLMDSGGFLLQCGDPTGTGRGGPGYTFADETKPSDTYPAGTVAMANAGPNTNGSQFFLVWGDTGLPPKYTVFGKMDAASITVIKRIASQGQDGSWRDGTGVPNDPALIKSVTLG